MIDLDRARNLAAAMPDDTPVTVSTRWLKQAIHEIAMGRSAQAHIAIPCAALDYPPALPAPLR